MDNNYMVTNFNFHGKKRFRLLFFTKKKDPQRMSESSKHFNKDERNHLWSRVFF